MKRLAGAVAFLILGIAIIIVPSVPCAAGPGGRADGTGAPLCTITSPANGTLVRGSFEVCGTAAKGLLPLTVVQVRVDNGTWRYAEGMENWTVYIDIALLVDGEHIIHARAADDNMSSAEASVAVIVRNPGRPVSSGVDLMCLVMLIVLAGIVAIVVLAALQRKRM